MLYSFKWCNSYDKRTIIIHIHIRIEDDGYLCVTKYVQDIPDVCVLPGVRSYRHTNITLCIVNFTEFLSKQILLRTKPIISCVYF